MHFNVHIHKACQKRVRKVTSTKEPRNHTAKPGLGERLGQFRTALVDLAQGDGMFCRRQTKCKMYSYVAKYYFIHTFWEAKLLQFAGKYVRTNGIPHGV